MLKIEYCPRCNSKEFTPVYTCVDYTATGEKFPIVDCKNCGFRFTNPVPKESEVGRYYESDEYISHSDTSKGIINGLYQVVRNITLKQKRKLVESHTKGRNLLDIGSGTGDFLNEWVSSGKMGKGIEPSTSARELSIKKHKLDITTEDGLTEMSDNTFDAVSMWHVLEHVYPLKERIFEIKRLLKPGGIAFIAVPNHLSYDAKKYKEYWAAYDVPRHLYHFREEDIVDLFSNSGFQHLETKPMKFDSYYVSMLSEKYKHGKQRLLSALLTGWSSNMKARKKSFGFSSQIYILQKLK